MESSFLEDYLVNPESFWPHSHIRNARKIKKFIAKGREGGHQEVGNYVSDIIDLARLRKRFNNKHVYLVNTGSAGSHWVEAMLGLLPGFYNGGEVYFPKTVRQHLASLSDEDANLFLDSVYLVHAGGVRSDSLTATLSNSAHLANHQQVSKYSINKKAVLLLRHPTNVVISRTFRKDEYKNDVAPTLSHKEYLEMNCVYVEKFFGNLEFESFDAIVKYEDFVKRPFESLKLLVDAIGTEACDKDLDNAIEMTSKRAALKSINKGEEAITNIYLGERKEYAWAKEYVNKRLENVISECGYKWLK